MLAGPPDGDGQGRRDARQARGRHALAPPASQARLDELGTFHEQTVRVRGRGWDEEAQDLVLPGLGWVAVTGCGECA